MKNFKPLKLALTIALAGGLTIGCQHNNTRASDVDAEEREAVSMETSAADATIAQPVDTAAADADRYTRLDENRRENLSTLSAEDRTVNFEFDSADLTREAKQSLDHLIERIGDRREVSSITIEGYTDATGPEEYNMDLSQRRAQSVQEYLQDKGVNARDWNLDGRGEDSPVADNGNAEGLSENRRVVIEFSPGDNRGLTYGTDE